MRLRSTMATLCALAAAGAAHAGTINYTTASTPACSAAQLARHDAIDGTQRGIDVYDPDGHFISWQEADGIFWRNWEPVDQFKHAFCGYQHHYSFYNPWYSGDEDDANKYLIPDPPFQFIINDAVAWGYSDPDDVHHCGTPQCIEAEVTHDQSYAGNPWFPHTDPATSPLNGRTLCTYGPWIADHGHGGRPEIHPSEAMWWTTTPTPAGVLRESRVVLMQDDSNRYDRRADFTPDLPSNIKPWSAWPRTAYLRHAFRVPQSGGVAEYLHVWESSRIRNITTGSNAALSADATTGTQHTLAFNGAARLTVVEHQPDANLGVVFDENTSLAGVHDVCRRSDGTLQGYVTLKSQFGVNDRGGEGYHELVLRRSTSAGDSPGTLAADKIAAAASAAPTAPVRDVSFDPASLRFGDDARGVRFSGDLLVELEPGASIASVHEGTRAVTTEVERGKRGGDVVRLVDVDLGSERVLTVAFASGVVVDQRLPGLAIDAELTLEPVAGEAPPAALDRAWGQLARTLGARAVARPAMFTPVAAWRAQLTPIYTARKDGRPSREDVFALARFLNDAAMKGTTSPLPLPRAIASLRWHGVDADKASATAYDQLAVIAAADRVSERAIGVELRDAFGSRVRREQTAPSHALVGDANALQRELLRLVAALANASPAQLAAPRADDADAAYASQASERGALDRLFRRAARDGVVTPAELAIQVELARRIDARH